MPVLGANAAAATNPAPGIFIPNGSLTAWRTARETHATARCEAVIFGDSTTYGSTYAGNGGNDSRSWVQQLRANALAAGYTDGGRGIAPSTDWLTLASPDSFVQSAGGTNWAASAAGVFNGESWVSTTVGAVIAFRGLGRYCRITWQDPGGTATAFSYTIDGGASVNVPAQNATLAWHVLVIDLGTNGDHTVTVTNQTASGNTVSAEFYRATGLVFHSQGAPGERGKTVWSVDATGNKQAPSLVALGLDGTAQTVPMFSAALANARRPALSVYAYGINDAYDMNAGGSTGFALSAWQMGQSLANWAAACDAAGCSKLVVVPHLNMGDHPQIVAGIMRSAIHNAARAAGCAIYDVQTRLGSPAAMLSAGYAGSTTQVHLTPAGYNAWGADMWTNMLGPAVG